MRKVRVLFVALVATLVFTGSALASADGRVPAKDLRTEIIELIAHPSYDILDTENMTANLRLMVNNNNELIVIDTGTENAELDEYLKSKLNYAKVSAPDVLHFNFYFVKLDFKK